MNVDLDVGIETLPYVEVELFPYRTAVVKDVFLKLPRNLFSDFEDALARKVQRHRDNHTVYGLTYDGKIIYIWFTDQNVIIGMVVERL